MRKNARQSWRNCSPTAAKALFLQGPLQFDYGCYTKFGKRCYANFNLVVLDVCPVVFGDDVFIGPNCSFVSPMHAYLPEERNLKQRPDGSYYDLEYGKPITVGNNCWFGSNVTVCGGVTIGDGCVIGAGSVVTRDIPANSLAAGSPCRVIRQITEQDSVKHHPELF
jgi:maltose O-acetyltransferase